MLIWINGAFGVGKSTTSCHLAGLLPTSLQVDPEWVGFLLRHHLSDEYPVADFQDYPSWRRLVPVVLDEMTRSTGRHVIAAQTVLTQSYWEEITNALADLGHTPFHVVLDADSTTLQARIDADDQEPEKIRPWRHDHVAAYEAARSWLVPAADLWVDTTHADAGSIAEQVLSAVSSQT